MDIRQGTLVSGWIPDIKKGRIIRPDIRCIPNFDEKNYLILEKRKPESYSFLCVSTKPGEKKFEVTNGVTKGHNLSVRYLIKVGKNLSRTQLFQSAVGSVHQDKRC
jgi:hypothetical protein